MFASAWGYCAESLRITNITTTYSTSRKSPTRRMIRCSRNLLRLKESIQTLHRRQARQRVLVQAFYFTSAPIAKAIMEAKKRGVQCQVVLDASQETQQYSSATFFYNQGIPIVIDDRHAIAHNKIILIDSDTIITGSFNFTRSADDSNAENLLVFKNHTDLFAKYLANYELHRKHARTYVRESVSEATPRAPPTTKPQKPEEKQVTVYVTKSGSKYHKGHCSYLRKSKIPMSLKDAARRYTPCSRCRPPNP